MFGNWRMLQIYCSASRQVKNVMDMGGTRNMADNAYSRKGISSLSAGAEP